MTLDISAQDTICALATPAGTSALAIIRMSGTEAFEIHRRLFRTAQSKPQTDRVATLGYIHDPDKRGDPCIDQCISLTFAKGQSFTGEASVEYNLHGNPMLIQHVLGLLQAQGARLAEPGEFSFRAMRSGQMTLPQAEGVYHLIHAKSSRLAQTALKQLQGGNSHRLTDIRTRVIDILAELESRLDFPDEPIGAADQKRLQQSLEQGCHEIAHILAQAQLNEKIIGGYRVVLLGPPNAGKSTLLNMLAKSEKAIVHAEPGTTRDRLEVEVNLDGQLFTFIDVAGVRTEGDISAVEQIGIERALQTLDEADLILACDAVDRSQDIQHPAEQLSIEQLERTIYVSTKSDLGVAQHPIAIRHDRLESLRGLEQVLLQRLSDERDVDEDMLLVTQKSEIVAAQSALQAAQRAFTNSAPEEIICSELRQAGHALDKLLGQDLSLDVIDTIFSRFCIGK